MRKTGNINFVLIGARATGKTVYLASLFLNEKSVTSKDGHTIEYLQPLSDSLFGGKYPQATAGTLHELMFNYKNENISCQIQIDDVDGYFIETMHKEDETTQRERDKLIENIKNAEGIIFFFPFEENFNEESIKNFNYEIDTVISEITKMYNNYDYIPIPTVIAVTKWDNSPDFKAEDEDDKVLEYIKRNEFLNIAKDKIEHHFPNLSIIPLSAVGNNVEHMQPYNLTKPLEFFVEETYKLWETKIESIKENKRELLKFLSRVHFDMKFYKEAKYNRVYEEIEKEFVDEILLKVKSAKNYAQFENIEKEYEDVISYLVQKNRNQIEQIGKKLKSKQTVKKVSLGTILFGIVVVIGVLSFGWYVKTELLKTESEYFSDIEVEYRNGNYKDAYNDILDYQEKYKETLDSEHKNSIEEMKMNIIKAYTEKLEKIVKSNSLIKQHDEIEALYNKSLDTNIEEIKIKYKEIMSLYKDYQEVVSFSKSDLSGRSKIGKILNRLSEHNFIELQTLKDRFKERLTSMANNLISNNELDGVDGIDSLLDAFTSLGIDSQSVVQKLMDKRNDIQKNNRYYELRNRTKKLNYKEAIETVERDWNDNFSNDKAFVISDILEKKFNVEIEKIIKDMPTVIGDMDNLNNVRSKLKETIALQKNTELLKINYKPKLTNINQNQIKDKSKKLSNYEDALNNGVKANSISFSAKSNDNEPLGFDCDSTIDSDDDIVLMIESTTYNYDSSDATCEGVKITWIGKQKFLDTQYKVTIQEIDSFDNDEYSNSFSLTKNDIINLYNKEKVTKDIGKGYSITLGEN